MGILDFDGASFAASFRGLQLIARAGIKKSLTLLGLIDSWVRCFDGAAEAAAGGEFADDGGGCGFAGFDDVGQNFVDGVFVEDAEISVAMDITLECFEFEATFVWDIRQMNGSEIRQAGFGTDRGVFRYFNGDDVARVLVGPGFQSRQFGGESALGMLFGIGRFG